MCGLREQPIGLLDKQSVPAGGRQKQKSLLRNSVFREVSLFRPSLSQPLRATESYELVLMSFCLGGHYFALAGSLLFVKKQPHCRTPFCLSKSHLLLWSMAGAWTCRERDNNQIEAAKEQMSWDMLRTGAFTGWNKLWHTHHIIPKWSHFKYSFEVNTIEINYSIKHSIAKSGVIIFDNLQTVFSSPLAINHVHWVTSLLPKVLVTSPQPRILAGALWKAGHGSFPAWRRQSNKLPCRYLEICSSVFSHLLS